MKVMSRAEAIHLGAPRYYTGRPCKAGHVAERLTANGDCVQCSKARVSKQRDIYRKAREAANGQNP